MPVLDRIRPGDAATAALLAHEFEGRPPQDILEHALTGLFPGKIAVVSSFGADSAVLLHMVSRIDPRTPVIFIDTGHLFGETLAYRDRLVAHLGLTNVQTFHPAADDLLQDPEQFLWSQDPDLCCGIRKVLPLTRALAGYDAWISGRKRFQADTRRSLPLFEAEDGRTKVNPLAAWSASEILDYARHWALPAHDLVAKRFLSIGCMPCTSPVRPGEDARAGRWRGKGKVECGIHVGTTTQGSAP